MLSDHPQLWDLTVPLCTAGVNHLQHTKWIALAAVALKLPHIMLKAASALKHWTLDINTLMTIAVAGGPRTGLNSIPIMFQRLCSTAYSPAWALSCLKWLGSQMRLCKDPETPVFHRRNRYWAVHGGGRGGGAVLRRGAPGAQLQVRWQNMNVKMCYECSAPVLGRLLSRVDCTACCC